MYELDIDSIFSYHPPKNENVAQSHEVIRSAMRDAASFVKHVVPDSAEKTLAIRHLQMAMMFANSAIAQHGS